MTNCVPLKTNNFLFILHREFVSDVKIGVNYFCNFRFGVGPNVVLNVVSREESSSNGMCQNPFLTSSMEKHFAPYKRVPIFSIVGRG